MFDDLCQDGGSQIWIDSSLQRCFDGCGFTGRGKCQPKLPPCWRGRWWLNACSIASYFTASSPRAASGKRARSPSRRRPLNWSGTCPQIPRPTNSRRSWRAALKRLLRRLPACRPFVTAPDLHAPQSALRSVRGRTARGRDGFDWDHPCCHVADCGQSGNWLGDQLSGGSPLTQPFAGHPLPGRIARPGFFLNGHGLRQDICPSARKPLSPVFLPGPEPRSPPRPRSDSDTGHGVPLAEDLGIYPNGAVQVPGIGVSLNLCRNVMPGKAGRRFRTS